MFNKKKIASLLLAGVMTASLAVPAFAADDPPENTIIVSGQYKDVDIDVTLSTQAGKVFVNPYALPITVDNGKTDAAKKEVEIKNKQIVTTPMWVSNESTVDLDVNAQVTLTEMATGLKFTTETIAADDTNKSINAKLQMVSATAITGTSIIEQDAMDAFAKETNWASAVSLALPTAVNRSTSSTDEELKLDKMVTLKQAKVFTSGVNEGQFDQYQAGSVAFVRLDGTCTKAPKTAWAETDTFKVSIAFTFSPAVSSGNG